MRRPSPLPPDPEREQSAADADRGVVPAPVDVPPRVEIPPPATAGPDTVTAPIPLIPGSGGSADPDAPSPAPAPQAGSDTEALPAEPEVGARELWRAARARRRALTSEVRRFTARQRRRRAVWLVSIGAVILVAAGTIGAAYSPLLAVETVTVVGAEQLDPVAVADALSDQVGRPLPLVSDSEIKAALVGFPLVESYTVEARPPHELVIRVVERTPVGVIESSAGYTLVDAAGVALSTTPTPAPGSPLLTVTGGVSSDAFDAVGRVIRSLPPEIMVQVTEVSATSPNDVTLTLGGTGTRVVWGSAQDSAMKSLVLQTTMLSRPANTVAVYDVSSAEAVVIQ